MKNSLGFFLILVAFEVQSQTEITVDIDDKRLSDIQTSSIGDSLFIAQDWFDKSEPPKLKKGYWISPLGEVKEYEFGFAQRLILCGVERPNINEHYYYVVDLSQKKKHVTNISIYFNQDVNLKNVFRLKEGIEIPGDYLGADSSGGNTTLFFFDAQTNSIRCQLFKTGKAKEQFIILLPFKIRSDIVFLGKMQQTSFSSGKAENKVYFESGELILLSDEPKDETVIFRTSLDSKESKTFKLASNSRNSIIKDNSFLYGNCIYKFTIPEKEIQLTVFDLESGNEIYKKDLSRLNAFGEVDVYHQTGFVTFKGNNLKKLLATNTTSTKFMIVEPFSSSNKDPLIVFGSYLETKGATPFLLNPYNIAGSIAAGILANAIWQAASKEYSVSKYAYMHGSPTDKFTLVAEFNNPKPIRQIIDDYEITQGQPKFDYDLKMYQTTVNGIFGIYHAKKERKLRLVRF